MAIQVTIEATVKVPDISQLENQAFDAAVAELTAVYPVTGVVYLSQEYNGGEYWFTFDVSGAVPA